MGTRPSFTPFDASYEDLTLCCTTSPFIPAVVNLIQKYMPKECIFEK